MASIIIVYHSAFGHTRAIAESVGRGAIRVEGVAVEMISVDAFPDPDERGSLASVWDDLHQADALIFGCPTYMGSVSAALKAFMDASSAVWFEQRWRNKLAAGFTVGGGLSGDKLGALQAMCTFACQHSMIWVSQGVGVNDAGIDRLGSSLGMMAQAGNAPIDETPPEIDHRTAEAFGERIARAALRWRTGE